MEVKNTNTIAIDYKLQCEECGWPIVVTCCDDNFKIRKVKIRWDWWYYCSNKGCKNHEGQGAFQNLPEWIQNLRV